MFVMRNVICALCLLQFLKCENDIIISDVQVEDNNDDVSTEEENVGTIEPFIPTKEWQIVKPNQPVPKGLHIRMNFQTGIKEAKLLEEESTESSPSCADGDCAKGNDGSAATGPKVVLSEESKSVADFPQNDKIYVTKKQLKDALLEFRDKVGTKVEEEMTEEQLKEQLEHENKVKKKFRTIEEIKAELKDASDIHIKSDVEIMKELVHIITADNSTVVEKCSAIDNLEYYVHQIDNAVDLDRIGGLEPIVLLLNSTEEDIQERAAKLIGAAVQNNKEVKNIVLRYGGLRLLLQLMHREKTILTKKRALYALSALVRDNPDALNELVKSNGVKSIIHVIKDKSLPTALQVKAIDLLFGLIEEQNEIMKRLKGGSKTSIPEESNLNHLLVENGLCNILVPLIKSDDFYMKEKVMHAIKVSIDVCKDTLLQRETIKHLEIELVQLEENIKKEDDDEFKSYLQTMKDQFKENVLDKLKQWSLNGGKSEL